MSETEDHEYAYSSDEEEGYPIDDESNMEWASSEKPEATKYSSSNMSSKRKFV
jgi:hypothetical protein